MRDLDVVEQTIGQSSNQGPPEPTSERATTIREFEDPLVRPPDRGEEIETRVLDVTLEVLCGRDGLGFRFGMKLDASHRSVERAFLENLLRGDAGDLAGFELAESTLGLLKPGLLSVPVGLRVEAGEEALGEPGPAPWVGTAGLVIRCRVPGHP